MAAEEKPYRLYRGGRSRGRIPLERYERQSRRQRKAGREGETPVVRRRRRRFWPWVLLVLVLVLAILAAWGGTSYSAFERGIKDANARVAASVLPELTPQEGLLTSTPTTVLVLGTDGASTEGRDTANRADSIILMHTDPGNGRLAYLSIPRDLQVEVPGIGTAKINAAFQSGGATLTLRTVKALTGLEVNHVLFVDFDRFRGLIDAVGGIDVDVPAPIQSNRFDCPFDEKRCATWEGWRFERGRQHMDGRRALVYARIRENRLDPSETDFTRGRRQQQVIQAALDRVTSISTAVRFPFDGAGILSPLATDLTAWEAVQLGWVYFRADSRRALHCRLGGDPATVGGQSVILASEDNVGVLPMFLGRSAPLPPAEGFPYAPGCVVGTPEPSG